jgi:hypothetical protein
MALTSERRGTFQFLGVACLIVSALFIILSIPLFWGQIRVVRSWPVRQAQVIRSQVVVQPSAKHEQLYAAKLQIVYVVDGQPVIADLISVQSPNYEDVARRAAEFPLGSRHAIRYNPHHPTDARIGASWNRRFFAVPLITLACGLVFAALAGGFFLASRFATAPQAR